MAPNPTTRSRPIRTKTRILARRRLSLLILRRGIKDGYIRWRSIPKWIKQCLVIALAAEAVTYSSIMCNWISPALANKRIDPFLSPSFSRQMYVSWIIYYFSQDVERLLLCYVICKIAKMVSDYLFLAFIVILGYKVFDCLMFFWDFKRQELIYIDAFWTMLMLIWSAFNGYKVETISKLKSLF